MPKPRDDYIIVKTEAVALNPTDWKGMQRAAPGAIIGCDYVGTVEQVGKNVPKSYKVGDKVAGFIRGCGCCSFILEDIV